jgi:hypothetical protein
MMKYFKIKGKVKILILMPVIALAGAVICSCDRDELFEREQYKKVFALLSSDDAGFNVFTEEHDLELVESEGFVSVVCGGSLPTEKDINVTLVEDEELLSEYNTGKFGEDENKYARWLPHDKYDIANYSITVPAGERTGLMSIKIRPNGLSPDSTYFIPLSIDRFTAYELNPAKSNVLYRLYMKNYYATNKSTTYYSFRGKIDGVNAMRNKEVFPVSGNSVRIMAGDITFESKTDIINGGSILATVDENGSVRIEAWKDIAVTQVDGDPDYPNTFSIYDDGYKTYKTFLLRYDYVYRGIKHSVQEELRLEFKEDDKY